MCGLYDLYCASHHIVGMAMRVVVGDLSESEVPAYEDAFDRSEGSPPLLAPLGKFLERELNEFSGSNDGCEWAWLTPKEMLDAPALDPANVQSGDGRVRFE